MSAERLARSVFARPSDLRGEHPLVVRDGFRGHDACGTRSCSLVCAPTNRTTGWLSHCRTAIRLGLTSSTFSRSDSTARLIAEVVAT